MDRLTGPGWTALHIVVALCVLLFVPLGLGALTRRRRPISRTFDQQTSTNGQHQLTASLNDEQPPSANSHQPTAALNGGQRVSTNGHQKLLASVNNERLIVRWWPAVAVPAVVALVLPRGVVAGVLCLPYLLACLTVPVVLRRERLVAFAAACLPVAAVGLVAERGGIALFGFPAGVLGLTAAHFHVAGFGALLLLALAEARFRLVAPVGVAVVGAGFLIGGTAGDVVELVGAGVLTAGLWLALAVRARDATRAEYATHASQSAGTGNAADTERGTQAELPARAEHPAGARQGARAEGPARTGHLAHADESARTGQPSHVEEPAHAEHGARGERLGRAGSGAWWLFGISLVTMSLALLYAAGQVVDIPHLGLTWMVLTHGVLNAGAVLVALVVAWAGGEQPWSEHTWSHRIGAGRGRFEAASVALLSWDMHRRSGAWVDPGTPPATPGLRMLSSLGVGRLRVAEPCEVREVVRQSDRTVMHYVALPGHTFNGDERFSVLLAPGGEVRFEITVRSQPSLLIARLAGPLVPVAQWVFIARCAAALRTAELAAAPART
ncbi:YndJ family transporter [Actinoplanes sp. Pm04-4]|uniref:YndJ family transporter n=1 Tax=Paractinoplanes pyxinae TaxID=2997416 RepID=A0ABT4BIT2_9ACTN|nr:YndJ family transporter [Actinoplanes pyxinae]MCY1145500.1 YndJ family transporter [Actinoplanes pyxinae]